MIKKLLFCTVSIFFSVFFLTVGQSQAGTKGSSKHTYKEAVYQHAWCSAHNGTEEYKNDDFTRVDCLTDTHAVEFDFAKKWAESVGQAEYYAYKTGKRGMVVLILENPKKEYIYYKRVKELGKIHGFDTEYVTPKLIK